jgi:hypothetical protein
MANIQKVIVVNGEIWSAGKKKILQFLEAQLNGRKPAIFDYAKRKDANPFIVENINDRDEVLAMIAVIKEEIAADESLHARNGSGVSEQTSAVAAV